jgi:hypothetical protein
MFTWENDGAWSQKIHSADTTNFTRRTEAEKVQNHRLNFPVEIG